MSIDSIGRLYIFITIFIVARQQFARLHKTLSSLGYRCTKKKPTRFAGSPAKQQNFIILFRSLRQFIIDQNKFAQHVVPPTWGRGTCMQQHLFWVFGGTSRDKISRLLLGAQL